MERIGRFQVVKELGRGAMGVVYHAIDPSIGRPVAIKTIRLGEVTKPEDRARLQERLLREARSAGILSHPNIVTIYDIDQEAGLAYIAMEFVSGPTLDQILSGLEPVERERMFKLLRQTAAALDYAHGKQIVHRDVKPGNIMLAEGDVAKIADFGIAKLATSELTLTGTIVGTPNYMSPEQVQGLSVDGRSDQFSLAVIAYEMLTGERPFAGDHLTTVVYRIVAEQPAPSHRLNPTLGEQIDAVLRRGLAKRPEERFASCTEFVEALESACNSTPGWKNLPRGGVLTLPTMAAEPRPEAGLAAALPPPRARRADSTEERPRRARTAPLLAALAIAVGLAGAIGWQLRRPGLGGALGSAPGGAQPGSGAPDSSAGAAVPAGAAAPEAAGPEADLPPSPESLPESGPATGAAGPPPGGAPVGSVQPGEPPAEPADAAEPEKQVPQRRPSPMSPPAGAEAAAQAPASQRGSESARARETRPVVELEVAVATNPPGATATLDGRAETACATPCAVRAAPGAHTIEIALAEHLTERREIRVTDSAFELPLVRLRRAAGILMLSSDPAGASISLDGKPLRETTPAQLRLPTGIYTVVVEKDGLKKSERVEIRNGVTSFLKVPLAE